MISRSFLYFKKNTLLFLYAEDHFHKKVIWLSLKVNIDIFTLLFLLHKKNWLDKKNNFFHNTSIIYYRLVL